MNDDGTCSGPRGVSVPTVTGDRGRDRDDAGRPRQGRPRDALGRPLPYGTAGVEPVPEEALPPVETVNLARRLVQEGRPFAAHEVLEARWKAGPDEERDLWQGLAQVCVGLTHAARGNSIGAAQLLERGAARVEEYEAGHGPAYGLDLIAIIACAREHAMIAIRSSPYAGPWPASYSSTRAAPRSRSWAAPTLLPRAACVRPTQTCARPCHKSRSSSGPAFQRASKTSCAANGRPSCTSPRAKLTVSTGGSAPSGTGSTPAVETVNLARGLVQEGRPF